MSQTKTVSISGETKIEFDAVYPYVWVRNLGNSALTVWGDVGDTVSLSKLEAVRVITNTDYIYVSGTGSVEVIAQGIPDSPYKGCGGGSGGGGGDITVESLSVTDNGTYTAPSGKAYSPVSVDVQPTLQPIKITENGVYTVPSGYDGYGTITVEVETMREVTTLWTNESTSNPSTITLSDDFDAYDELIIELKYTAGQDTTKQFHTIYPAYMSVGEAINLSPMYTVNGNAYIVYAVTSKTVLTYSIASGDFYLSKIIGVKYTVSE